ncbi:hypothetical protein [Croceibacterium aestuarii]|uniref:hypothetical protein n=1 Tax=Croceibacterium aestuarii TaxID=3064139 RepID=UPI00272E1AEF|nr:hypothetical protein [Croceibacterium sp. D39]
MTTAEMTRSGQSAPGASGSDTKQELKADADRLKETAKDRASEEADKRKGQATRAARSTSDALEKAAGELDRDNDAPSWLSSAFRETAKGIDRMAGKVEGRRPEEMGRDLSRFAREHPTTFLAASAAAGFAAARFLRAGADYKHEHEHAHNQDSARRGDYGAGAPGEWTAGRRSGRFDDATRAAQQQYGASGETAR